jgi:hypothetical protein
MFYISNAFSLNMVNKNCQVRFINLTIEQAAEYCRDNQPTSYAGHADTAAVAGGILGYPIAENRGTLCLNFGDELIVTQYSGPRLPVGATELPEGASFRFIRCVVEYLDYI